MNRKRIKWAIFFVAITVVAAVIVYAGLVIGKVINLSDSNNSVIISSLSFAGTIVLGAVSVYQTVQANQISNMLFKDTVNCDLIPTKNVLISKCEFNTQAVVDFASKHETEGLYCEIENKQYDRGKDDKYLKLQLSFKTAGSFLENCTVDNIYLNKSFGKDKEHLKKFYCKFKILNSQKRLILNYNPCDELYYLEIYMRDDEVFKTINDKECFVVDLELKLTSMFSTERIMTYSLNFGNINGLDMLDCGKVVEQDLTNVIIHRNDTN